ncbi:myristylprotein [Murmansk poxvirus]|uniref:Myristylprotein n=1 Tax=Murmansk poxvirus TaxID=2025359 RepID=A0A223FMS1_9POXV|nr:myristylprotein [Murmansk poxvirus]AST09278.1 myristylprotein [Murmansk poxvirus]
MGGGSSVELPKRDPLPPIPTTEMKLDVDKMHDVIAPAKLLETVFIGKINKDIENKIKNRYPEFRLVNTGPGGLSALIREQYKGTAPNCCRMFDRTHYWKKDGNIFDKFEEGSVLESCWPDSHDAGKCDTDLFNWCQGNTFNKDVCHQWIGSAFNRSDRTEEGEKSVRELFGKLIALCSKDASIPICESFLYHLRAANRETSDDMIDYILRSQSAEFKQKYMRCSYPTRDKLEESLKYSEPRECWDPECINANVNFLLTRNYNNLGLCNIVRCNASVNNLQMDDSSSLRLSCGLNSTRFSTSPVNREKVVQHNVKNSFDLKLHVLSLLSILVIWLLIVAI